MNRMFLAAVLVFSFGISSAALADDVDAGAGTGDFSVAGESYDLPSLSLTKVTVLVKDGDVIEVESGMWVHLIPAHPPESGKK